MSRVRKNYVENQCMGSPDALLRDSDPKGRLVLKSTQQAQKHEPLGQHCRWELLQGHCRSYWGTEWG